MSTKAYSMETNKALLASVSGTTFMTLFSQALSSVVDENFNEADLLSRMLVNIDPAMNKKTAKISGWAGHYAIGMLFAVLYARYLKKTSKKPSIKNALVFGALSGLTGMMVWKLTLKMHPIPPRTKYDQYYLQLLPAHIVFGIFTALTYKLLVEREEKQVSQQA